MISDSMPAQTPGPEPVGGDPSVTPASRPRWLLPASVAVVVLAVAIGLVAGVTLTDKRTGAGASGAASYVPADATFYYEIDFDPSLPQRANLRAFLGHFSKLDPDKALTDELDQQLDRLTPTASGGYRYSTDVKPWFDGTLAAALVGFPSMLPGASSTTTPRIPDLLLFAGVKDAEAANHLNDRIRADAARNGKDVQSTEHGAATIWSVRTPVGTATEAGTTFAWTIMSDQVVAGTSVALVGQALDVHAGSSGLASRQEFRDGLARLPSDHVALVSVNSAPMVAQMKEDLAAASPSLSPLIDALGSSPQVFAVETARFESDRFVLDGTGSVQPAQPTGGPSLAASAPADALFFADIPNAGKGLTNLVNVMRGTIASTGGAGAGQLDQVEKVLGGDLGSFVSWMGDGAIVAGETGAQPYAGLIATTTDSAQARTKLLQLVSLIQLGSLSNGPKVTVSDADHNGTTIYTIHVEAGTSAPPWATTFQYAVTDNRVVIGSGDAFVARVLDASASSSLAGQQRFQAALQGLGGDAGRAAFWIDLSGVRAAVERLLPADANSAYQSAVQPWVAPFDYIAATYGADGERTQSRIAIVVK